MNKPLGRAGTAFGFNPNDDLNDLRISEAAVPLLEHVKRFIAETVEPMSVEFHRLGEGRADRWSWAPGQLEEEMAQNAWLTCDADAELLFTLPFEQRWQAGIHKLGIDPAFLASEAGHA